MSRRRIGFWYRLAAVICKPPLLVLFKRDWRGMEHIPADGGFITAVNHNSYLDPLSYAHYQYNTGRVPRFLAKAGLFKSGFVGLMMRGTGQIPVYRETTDAATAFRAAVSAIETGECVAFYPEGTLTRDPELWPMQGKTGAARVALLTKAPVIPVAQWGAHEAMPPYAKEKKLRLLPRKTLLVQAGPPVDLSAFYDQEPTAEVLRAVTEVIMAAITEQLAVLRGESVPAEPYDWRKAVARERRAAREAAKAGRGAAAATAPAEPAVAPEPAVGSQQARSTQQAQEDESK
ncbi:lysophospholipid acyltransferase family protein [Streptomyces auratus]|uniref:1-acyl-sn-glycerol-3-phosphate acyltransferase n=1 Tax=Streptomyces auratus AGR0001 TaxID=1160718 RepID=J1RTV8_9ACTN|nr:lysophospholipid acyltransferase family protein [Streptomyces auratus]QTZ94313.1 1-acyl-sn-glycerol-3-phosphate acyltransferase [Streptomyces auratus AGR0001]